MKPLQVPLEIKIHVKWSTHSATYKAKIWSDLIWLPNFKSHIKSSEVFIEVVWLLIDSVFPEYSVRIARIGCRTAVK